MRPMLEPTITLVLLPGGVACMARMITSGYAAMASSTSFWASVWVGTLVSY